MRKPRYLSPTSIDKFYSDRDEFYLMYLADERPPRMPQTQPMAIGSAFDAYVKSYLIEKLFGDKCFDKMFEQMVEPQNRDWAIEEGKYVFEHYRECGKLASLMLELERAVEEPRFEFTVEARVAHETCVDGVPLLGKPDVFFKTKDDGHVIYDWKVNGYCSKSNKSPAQGYIDCDGKMHKKCQPMIVGGLRVNRGMPFEHVDERWATQTTIYGWVLGEPVGGDTIIGIDQICAWGAKRDAQDRPKLRVATHRGLATPAWQHALMAKIAYVWQAIQSPETVFADMMTADQSRDKCICLDSVHKIYESADPRDAWIASMRKA